MHQLENSHVCMVLVSPEAAADIGARSHAPMSAADSGLTKSTHTILNSTQQDITDVGADTSYVRIYISNLITTL